MSMTASYRRDSSAASQELSEELRNNRTIVHLLREARELWAR